MEKKHFISVNFSIFLIIWVKIQLKILVFQLFNANVEKIEKQEQKSLFFILESKSVP